LKALHQATPKIIIKPSAAITIASRDVKFVRDNSTNQGRYRLAILEPLFECQALKRSDDRLSSGITFNPMDRGFFERAQRKNQQGIQHQRIIIPRQKIKNVRPELAMAMKGRHHEVALKGAFVFCDHHLISRIWVLAISPLEDLAIAAGNRWVDPSRILKEGIKALIKIAFKDTNSACRLWEAPNEPVRPPP
jgi:hypothetical protein